MTVVAGRLIKVLDHGYVRFVEDWGRGDALEQEAGIIEAARQSTQGSFRGWDDRTCDSCNGTGVTTWPSEDGGSPSLECGPCAGSGRLRGDYRLLSFLYTSQPKHATPFEFAGMTVEVQAPIFVFREWHRHRTQSYNEMSARYSLLPDLNYLPDAGRLFLTSVKNKQAGTAAGAGELDTLTAASWLNGLERLYESLEAHYQLGLRSGVPKEIARLAMSVGRYSRMRASANLRNWLAFLTLRMDEKAQWEIRQYANAVAEVIAERFPRVWSLFDKERKG